MRHPRFVRRGQRTREVHREAHELLAPERAPSDALVERLAVDELHREPEAARQLHEVVDPHDVRVRHLAGHLQLAAEPLEPLVGALVVLEQLESDDGVGLQIASAVDDALGPAPHLGEYLVAAAEDVALLTRRGRLRRRDGEDGFGVGDHVDARIARNGPCNRDRELAARVGSSLSVRAPTLVHGLRA